MNSFGQVYLDKVVVPQRIITMMRKLGEHKGRQELYKKQAPEMLENLRQVALIQSTESSNRALRGSSRTASGCGRSSKKRSNPRIAPRRRSPAIGTC